MEFLHCVCVLLICLYSGWYLQRYKSLQFTWWCEFLLSVQPTHAGGSLQGRAAHRLARLFLVYEAAGQVAPPRDLGALTVTPQCTPIGHRIFKAFFESPAPHNCNPQASKSVFITLEESNDTTQKAVPEHEVSLIIMLRIHKLLSDVFSKRQCYLPVFM